MTEQEQYLHKKYDYIPICAELIEHVRRLDGFNVSLHTFAKSFLGGRTFEIEGPHDPGRQEDGKYFKSLTKCLQDKSFTFKD